MLQTLKRSFYTVIILAVSLTPVWAYVAFNYLAEPVGFWQNFALVIACVVLMGWLQVFLIIFFVASLEEIWGR